MDEPEKEVPEVGDYVSVWERPKRRFGQAGHRGRWILFRGQVKAAVGPMRRVERSLTLYEFSGFIKFKDNTTSEWHHVSDITVDEKAK